MPGGSSIDSPMDRREEEDFSTGFLNDGRNFNPPSNFQWLLLINITAILVDYSQLISILITDHYLIYIYMYIYIHIYMHICIYKYQGDYRQL